MFQDMSASEQYSYCLDRAMETKNPMEVSQWMALARRIDQRRSPIRMTVNASGVMV